MSTWCCQDDEWNRGERSRNPSEVCRNGDEKTKFDLNGNDEAKGLKSQGWQWMDGNMLLPLERSDEE